MDLDAQGLKQAIDAVKAASPLPPGLGDAIGRVQMRFLDNPVSRWITRHVVTEVAAFLIVSLGLFGVRKPRRGARTAAAIALEWQKVAAGMKIDTLVESATAEQAIVVHARCTMGYQDGAHRCLCDASMNMDHQIVRRLGGDVFGELHRLSLHLGFQPRRLVLICDVQRVQPGRQKALQRLLAHRLGLLFDVLLGSLRLRAVGGSGAREKLPRLRNR